MTEESKKSTTSELKAIQEKEALFSCRIFNVVMKYQKGRSGRKLTRYVVEHPGGVGVLPILPDGRILLIRQFRSALNEFIYEIPAGTREAGEKPVETARRELIEETGWRADTLTPLPSFYSSPGFLTERIDLYLATDLIQDHQALEDGEELTLTPFDQTTVQKMINSGEIKDGKTLVALLDYFFREKTFRPNKTGDVGEPRF